MPPRDASTPVSTGAQPLQNSRSPANSSQAMSRITHGAQNDTSGGMAQPLSPAVQTPAPGPTHDQSASIPQAPFNLHFLAQYYRTGEYADLEVVSNGVERSVHKVIVCSQSPVIKHKCSLRRDYRVELNEYDPETVERVLDFCYRRTYSDGEYPETVTPLLLRMTTDDVRDALESPLAVASDVDSSRWRGRCTQCDDSDGDEDEGEEVEGEENEGDEDEGEEDDDSDGDEDDSSDGVQDDESGGEEDEGEALEEEVQEEGEDEYLPDRCEIDYFSDENSESSGDEMSPVSTPSGSKSPTELSQPPYPISLFTNLKVYIAAKELQIPALQLLSRERFAHTLRSHRARISDLPALIEQVYLRTDNSDHLRSLISQIVAAEYDREYGLDFKVKVREVMARNGEFATDVLDAVLRLRCEWADMA